MGSTPDSILGIDIAKAKVDTLFQGVQGGKPTHRIYDNTAAGHQKLLEWLARKPGGTAACVPGSHRQL